MYFHEDYRVNDGTARVDKVGRYNNSQLAPFTVNILLEHTIVHSEEGTLQYPSLSFSVITRQLFFPKVSFLSQVSFDCCSRKEAMYPGDDNSESNREWISQSTIGLEEIAAMLEKKDCVIVHLH